MKPKKSLYKHDFKSGKPKSNLSEHVDRLLDLTEVLLIQMEAYRNKSRTEKIIDWWYSQSKWDKIELLIMGLFFIVPSIIVIFFIFMSIWSEPNEYYEIYMDVLHGIRIFGLVSIVLIKSTRLLWKLKS